jgi:hypothetical protein
MSSDKQLCAELIQHWGLCRDQGRWDDLLGTFHPDGEIAVSWFRGAFRDFVARCRQSHEAGNRSKHLIWPSVVQIAGDRALAETNAAILVRQVIEHVPTDLTSNARFLDRLEWRGGHWKILERAAIYERDRLDPVEPSPAFTDLMQRADAARHPAAYRYMAYRVLAAGRSLAEPVFADGSAETAALYARYQQWLSTA